ncbi:protein adenylyltransferase SelO [Chachezhania antarctica]|uniref:protein adenylyltransferase SelO n=1 Tax=Chachezhania antarctica TaxID=2340860 RepID=UPI000EAE7EF8|nr:YdiU family protein [Chachezhania antarctica]|tara:strand:+ start:352 stop:1770 length:1419 start_codon:yes stop_codon:yes gene_type:complete
MSLHIPFDNSYARLPGTFFTEQAPTPVAAPRLVAFNEPLARLMGISPGEVEEMAQVFAGNRVPDGAAPLAQAYAGHQFGNFNPQLGDGRAVLLGETVGTDGKRRDLQLKGSGPTPYSRMGDGRAWLGPVLREYVVSEAMHALGIPTTRALAAVETGEPVVREEVLPGAVLARVASSHLRVGTFQIFAARRESDSLQRLTQYAIDRHYPHADGPMGLLAAVRDAQVRLIVQWLSVGFIHGVMNTDNCAISGETIDYGPCAFLDTYHPETVFSSIDRDGRYAYFRQPDIAVWNLAQFATALIQQLDDPEAAIEEASDIVNSMPELIRAEWRRVFCAKIGIAAPRDADVGMAVDLLKRMAENQADFTNTFRALSDGAPRDQFVDPEAFDQWAEPWRARLAEEQDPQAVMRAANPVLIPRNHRIEAMIAAAVDGDYAPFERLMAACARPFAADEAFADLRRPPAVDEKVQATFCGT